MIPSFFEHRLCKKNSENIIPKEHAPSTPTDIYQETSCALKKLSETTPISPDRLNNLLQFSHKIGEKAIAMQVDPAIIMAMFDQETVHGNMGETRFEAAYYNKAKGTLPPKKARELAKNGAFLHDPSLSKEEQEKIAYATSFGLPQIMGFNYKELGYSSALAFANDMMTGG